MPQLDLSWFLINFLLAWTSIIIIWITLNHQTWLTNNDNSPNNNNDISPQNNWNW
uniref:ATP synthase F0 subunit 8 n=1 Tax=Pseudocolochirus violaceus TaxID=2528974 RepID=A0A7G7YDP8_9ECHN|nr:ATP synthase F0 subunit 8 [Pseudocolochirus violaceus]QNH92618.1 ATP synthase F0 subunit 8 [Pseudocolochirus violaceus]